MSAGERAAPGVRGVSAGPQTPVDVGVLGATGLVGQRFVQILDAHPWFRLTTLVGSPRTAGRTYGDAVDWRLEGDPPPAVARLRIAGSDTPLDAPILFSALPSESARTIEPVHSRAGHWVFSNASAHRRTDGRVPVVPEVNAHRLAGAGPAADGEPDRLITNPNCVVAGLVLPLAALDAAYGLVDATVNTMQALSGAGLRGVSALAALGNVVPHIPGEAEKIAEETRSVLGVDIPISVAVSRVPVVDGHLAHVRVRLRRRPDPGDARRALASFRGCGEIPALPSAPDPVLRVLTDPARPQPARDLTAPDRMGVAIGGVVSDPVFDLAFTMLVHNTVRGAAGGSVLNAELAIARRLVT